MGEKGAQMSAIRLLFCTMRRENRRGSVLRGFLGDALTSTKDTTTAAIMPNE